MSLEEAIKAIHKQFGKESIIKMDQKGESIGAIPTGSPSLDAALGVGGYPRGRIIEIYGVPSGGKSTLALHAVAEAQKNGGKCAYLDVEHSLDLDYASAIGVNIKDLWFAQPSTGEEAFGIVDTLVRSNDIDIIVVDSVAALVPQAEMEGEYGQAHMGLMARLMSQGMRKLAGIISDSNCVVIFINQIRQNIVAYGNPETTPGGNALKFYSSVRLDIRKKDVIKNGPNIVGQNIKIKVVKNKVAPPLKEVETSILFGKGIDREGEILQQYIREEKITQAGPWYLYKEEKYKGREAILAALK